MKAIQIVDDCSGQFVSPIFIVSKSDGGDRLILNLKKLHEFIDNNHFKMEDHKTVLKVLQKGDFLAKVDLKDAYHLIPIAEGHRKFLRFRFNDKLFEYCCLPFGLSCAPRIFTKIIRPVVTKLRRNGYRSTVYLDDFLLYGESKRNCHRNVDRTVSLLTKLGFVLNRKKSVMEGAQSIEFLGFVYDSNNMTVSLPDRKKKKNITKDWRNLIEG